MKEKTVLDSYLINKVVNFNDSLELINAFYELPDDYLSRGIKIVTVIKANCPGCIRHIKYWEDLHKENSLFQEVTFVFILVGEFSHYTVDFFSKDFKTNFLVFYDPDNSFIISNRIVELEYKQSALIDESNKIVLVGSPVTNSNLLYFYEEKIGELLELRK